MEEIMLVGNKGSNPPHDRLFGAAHEAAFDLSEYRIIVRSQDCVNLHST
jgi:hypothetical protein